MCDLTLHRQMIGPLIHLRFTRPDLQFSVSYLARFMSNPNTEHLAAVLDQLVIYHYSIPHLVDWIR